MTFGERLKKLREEKKLTQEELGKIVNLSKANISKYEKNLVEANNETLTLLADYFEVSTDYLLGHSNIRNPYKQIKTSLGKIISEYREKNNLSLRDFGDRCGLSHAYIDKLEKGIDPRSGKKVEPTLDTICKVAKILGKSTNQLLEETGYIKPNPKSDKIMEKCNELLEDYIKGHKNDDENKIRSKGLYTTLIIKKLFEDGLISEDGDIDDSYVEMIKASLKTDSKLLKKDNR